MLGFFKRRGSGGGDVKPDKCEECGTGKVRAKASRGRSSKWLCKRCATEALRGQEEEDANSASMPSVASGGPAATDTPEPDAPAEVASQTSTTTTTMAYSAPPGAPTGPTEPAFLTAFPEGIGNDVENLHEHVQKLTNVIGSQDGINYDGFDREFKYLELREMRRSQEPDYSTALQEVNLFKNRYGNVLPPEHSRVPLRADRGDNGTFINANYVDGLVPGSEKRYITTQGPLDATFDDFWRLVWEQDVSVVLMLTREIEGGFIKCARYWPQQFREDELNTWGVDRSSLGGAGAPDDVADDKDETGEAEAEAAIANAKGKAKRTTGFIKVNAEHFVRQSHTYGTIRVTFTGTANGDEYIARSFALRNLETDETRQIMHFQYTGWPDFGIPVSAAGFVQLVKLSDKTNHTKGPILVHCSAGIGRTGTFCTVHATLELFKYCIRKGRDVSFNITETIYRMRGQRVGFVQTKEQFMFCYVSILEQSQQFLQDFARQAAERAAKKAAKREAKARSKHSSSRSVSVSGSSTKVKRVVAIEPLSSSGMAQLSPDDAMLHNPTNHSARHKSKSIRDKSPRHNAKKKTKQST